MFARQQDELGYRFYVSELLRLNAEGKTWSMSYLEYRDYRPPEERPVDDIIAEVIASAGITLEG